MKVGDVVSARYIARIVFLILFVLSLFDHIFQFMTLNLFLAYVPFELCFLLRLFKPQHRFEWPLFIIYTLIFIFMVPNTFYMITDLIHLKQFIFNFYAGLNLTEWMYFTYLLAGVFLALYCLVLMFREIRYFTPYRWFNRALILIMMCLNGFGIYIGRFLRLHSVYLINEPLRIVRKLVTQVDLKAMAFVLLMVALQLLLYIFMKGVRSFN